MGRVVVVGSANVDRVVRVPRLPAPGETVIGGPYVEHLGGKGANQAVAAARMGAQTAFIAAVGMDPDGDRSIAALRAEGIDCSRVVRSRDDATGVALIAVDGAGENQIAVASGANRRLDPERVATAVQRLGPSVLLAVLESPMPAVLAAIRSAVAVGAQVVLNPAPAHPLPDEVLAAHPILTPNRRELAALAGDVSADARAGARALLERGATAVAVTLGSDGVYLLTASAEASIPGERPGTVVDSTGAGDTFSGALAALLADGATLAEAAREANVAAALSCLGEGARGGIPRRNEVDAFLAAR